MCSNIYESCALFHLQCKTTKRRLTPIEFLLYIYISNIHLRNKIDSVLLVLTQYGFRNPESDLFRLTADAIRHLRGNISEIIIDNDTLKKIK